jgi:exopolysaccharide production protein ExoY
MNLVKSRTIVVEELEEYCKIVNEFLSVKLGMTGYWTVSGRSNVDSPKRADLELFYVYNQSLLFIINPWC